MRKEILRLAIPAIVSNITTPLLGLVDTAITGHMGSPVYLAAIALGGSMFSLSYWLLNFLRVSTSGLTSQAYGASLSQPPSPPSSSPSHASASAKDDPIAKSHQKHSLLTLNPSLSSLLHRSLSLALVLSLVLILISPWLADALIYFFNPIADSGALGITEGDLARTYFRILIFGAPAVLCTYSLTGWLLGMQNSRLPMLMSLTTNVTNIAASLILVYVFHLKIEGVAIGTLLAQYLGLILGVIHTHRRYHPFDKATYKPKITSFNILHSAFCIKDRSLNLQIFLRTLCLVSVTLLFTRAGARAGSDILAANALLMQLFILFSYFMDGFAFAGEAMAGKYYGARNAEMLRATVRGIFCFGAAVAIIFTLTYALAGRPILQILTDEPAVVDTAMTYLPWAIAIPAVSVAAFVWDGIFIGLTLSRQMLVSMFLAAVAFFLLYFTLPLIFSLNSSLTTLHLNHALWLSFLAYLLTRSIIQTIIYHRHDPLP